MTITELETEARAKMLVVSMVQMMGWEWDDQKGYTIEMLDQKEHRFPITITSAPHSIWMRDDWVKGKPGDDTRYQIFYYDTWQSALAALESYEPEPAHA